MSFRRSARIEVVNQSERPLSFLYRCYYNNDWVEKDSISEEIASREYHLLDFWPDPVRYTLRLQCVGRNPRSTGYYFGVESVRLRQRRPRVTEYGHDADEDWRAEPILYD